jgi:DNA-3-methyladenine glycosylase II
MRGGLRKNGKAAKPGKRAAQKSARVKTAPKATVKAKRLATTPLRTKSSKPAPRKAPKRKIARKPRPPNLYHPGPPIDGQAALDSAAARLLTLDPELVGKLIAVGGATPLRLQEPGFAGLIRIIVAQQVSTASANAIFKRVETILAPLSAATVLAADETTLRSCGLSSAKMRAFRAIAQAVQEGLDLTGLGALAAEEAHRVLVAVKGIGPWTADVFLLFSLGHPDAFPSGDIALQEAAKIVLGLKKRPNARRLEQIAERWRPLRGIAARMLWAYYRAARQRVGIVL